MASCHSNGWFSQVTPYRAATAALVEKQSREMLELINEKRSEYMMAESLYLDEGDGYTEDVLPYPSEAPIPAPPALSKFEVYNDPVEFADIDQIAISVRKRLNRADNLSDLWSASCYWHEEHTGLNDIPCFFIIKPTRCTNFTNLFWHETLHVSDSPSVHHQEYIHCTLSNGVICHRGL